MAFATCFFTKTSPIFPLSASPLPNSQISFTYDYLPDSHLIEKVTGPIHDVANV